MTALEFTIPLSLGVVSSVHCTQMCGPIVLAYSLPLGEARRGALAHVAYNLGRLLTYAMLGALAGAAGGGVATLGRLAGIERTAALVAGSVMIVAGILMSGWLPRTTLVTIGETGPLRRLGAARLLRSSRPASKFALGAALGFLPCGLIYAALLKALDTGSALDGALTMLAFGLGTSGALLAIGIFSTAITTRFRRYGTVMATASLLLLGCFLLWRGFTASSGQGHSHHVHIS